MILFSQTINLHQGGLTEINGEESVLPQHPHEGIEIYSIPGHTVSAPYVLFLKWEAIFMLWLHVITYIESRFWYLNSASVSQFVTHELGIKIHWDNEYSIHVTLDGNFYDNTCGMCGTYNDDVQDDLVIGPAKECIPKDIQVSEGDLVSDWSASFGTAGSRLRFWTHLLWMILSD